MIVMQLKPKLNHDDWVPWFAWHPVVTIKRKVVVFQYVLRKIRGISQSTVYKLEDENDD